MRSPNSVLNEALDPSGDVEYDNLPVDVRMHVTLKEYRWMGEQGRRRLMSDFTEPDYRED